MSKWAKFRSNATQKESCFLSISVAENTPKFRRGCKWNRSFSCQITLKILYDTSAKYQSLRTNQLHASDNIFKRDRTPVFFSEAQERWAGTNNNNYNKTFYTCVGALGNEWVKQQWQVAPSLHTPQGSMHSIECRRGRRSSTQTEPAQWLPAR